jgi:hypothetical protein
MSSGSRSMPGGVSQPVPLGAEVFRMEVPGGVVTGIARVWASAADMRRCRLCEAGCTGNLVTLQCNVGTRRHVPKGEAKLFRLPDPRRPRLGQAGLAPLGKALRVVGVEGADGGQGIDEA